MDRDRLARAGDSSVCMLYERSWRALSGPHKGTAGIATGFGRVISRHARGDEAGARHQLSDDGAFIRPFVKSSYANSHVLRRFWNIPVDR